MNQSLKKQILSIPKKLHFLDYLIIVIIVVGALITFRFLNKEEKWISAVILDKNISVFQAYSLSEHDIEKSPTGKKIAEIKSMRVLDTLNNPSSNKDVIITLQLLTKVNKSGEYEYKNKIIKIGSPIEIRFNSGLVNGEVMNLEGSKIEEKIERRTLTITLYDQWPWFADTIQVKQAEVNKNGNNDIEILSKEVVPAEITTVTSSGDTLLRTNPRKVDITLKVKTQVTTIGEEIIFENNQRIFIGNNFSFNIRNVNIKDAYITGIQ